MGNLDARVGHLEGRMLEQSEGIADIRESVARLDDKMSRQFIWTVGMLVTVLAAVVGGLLSQ